jgi:hypothetical protein
VFIRGLEPEAWCGGLFDGEGCVQYKKDYPKGGHKYKWRVSMEINMVHLDPIAEFQRIIGVGTITHKANLGFSRKDQWRWRCSHQKALIAAKKIVNFTIEKKPKLLAIINHYEFGQTNTLRTPERFLPRS